LDGFFNANYGKKLLLRFYNIPQSELTIESHDYKNNFFEHLVLNVKKLKIFIFKEVVSIRYKIEI